jgi:hypothetical protein
MPCIPVILTDRERALASEREWKDPDILSSAHAAAGSSLDGSSFLLLFLDASSWILFFRSFLNPR